MSNYLIREAAELLQKSSYTVALTGAGVSTPSGIPDFRSPSFGLWTRMDPVETASIWAFHNNPQAVYNWFLPLARTMMQANPNPAHQALADLERAGLLHTLITQNIDELHQRAGSQRVIQLHGHLRTATCLSCGQQYPSAELWPLLDEGRVPNCPQCHGLLKPDAILFGEPLNYDELKAAQEAALSCDVMIAAGSSLEVMPAADLPYLARRRGARVILVNHQPTAADSIAELVIRGNVATVLPDIVTLVLR